VLAQVRAYPGIAVKTLYRQWKKSDPSLPALLATHLCLLLDDHSRLVTFAAYGLTADTQAFLYCFQQAVRRRGLPRKLYTDNGGPFINDHLKIVCANLGLRLLHAKPY